MTNWTTHIPWSRNDALFGIEAFLQVMKHDFMERHATLDSEYLWAAVGKIDLALREIASNDQQGLCETLMSLGLVLGDPEINRLREKVRDQADHMRAVGESNRKRLNEKRLEFKEWERKIDKYSSEHPHAKMQMILRRCSIPRTRYYEYKKLFS